MTESLVDRISREAIEAMPRCPCGKWQTYIGHWDQDGRTFRCHGCLKAIGRCRC